MQAYTHTHTQTNTTNSIPAMLSKTNLNKYENLKNFQVFLVWELFTYLIFYVASEPSRI